jgi:protein transport protein SEC61 subunit beta
MNSKVKVGKPKKVLGTPTSSLGAGFLRFYAEDTPGLKVGPKAVLAMSLIFITFVAFLHIWGKFSR